MKLFVSYSRDDKNFVYELVERLKNEAEHDVWIDRELSGGQLWWDSILDNIETCESFILILTPLYIASVNCAAELNYALALDKVILPLLLKPCDLPEALRKIQYIDISDLSLNETFLRSARALIKVEASLLKRGYAAQFRAARPSIPVVKVDTPENIYEIFAAAEVAAAENNIAKAEALFQKAMKADPQGLGLVAAERLAQVRQQHDCATAYMYIVQLVEKGLIKGAQAAWYDYVQKFGPDYDPNNYITDLSDIAAPRGITVTPPPLFPRTHTSITREIGSQAQIELSEQKAELPTQLRNIQTSLENGPVLQDQLVTLVASDQKPMRLIPASKFFFGNGQVRELPDFYIDTWPVTNVEYRRFIQENNISPPSTWRMGKFPEKKANHPVTGVSWYEATIYAKWAGKRLPTVAEWEKAARGMDGRRYPWGEGFDVQRCNTSESGQKTTAPVTHYQTGASIYGVLDMAGNIWEWTTDEIKPRGLGRQNQETKRVLKGGSWKTTKGSAECAASTSAWPHEQLEDVGFRCVLPIDETQLSWTATDNGEG